MKHIFSLGDIKTFEKSVTEHDLAAFENDSVHCFYSTFSLARDAEWSSRLFVLDMKEDDEEGIGTYVNVSHKSPALIGDKLKFEAKVVKIEGNTVECEIDVTAGNRLIAKVETGQKILKKQKLERIVEGLKNG